MNDLLKLRFGDSDFVIPSDFRFDFVAVTSPARFAVVSHRS
jgi:hypothetical protein